MALEPQINNQNVGDPFIQTDNFNHMVDSTNRFNNFQMDATTTAYYSDDGVNVLSIPLSGDTVNLDSSAEYDDEGEEEEQGVRATVSVNPSENSTSEGLIQINDSESVAPNETLSLPYFKAEDKDKGVFDIGASGEIKWSAVDSTYKPNPSDDPISKTMTIEVDTNEENKPNDAIDPETSSPYPWDAVNNSYKIIGLKGATETPENSKSIPFYESGVKDEDNNWTQGELFWAAPDHELDGTAFNSVEIIDDGEDTVLSLYDFIGCELNAQETTSTKIENDDIQWQTAGWDDDDTKYLLVAVSSGGDQKIKYLYPTLMNVVTNVEWDGANHKLVQTKTPAYVLGYNTSDEVEIDITVATDC